MNRYFLILAALLCTFQVFSQGDSITIGKQSKFSISLFGGIAVPVGKFSEFETMNPNAQNGIKVYNDFSIAGAAGTGYFGGIDLIYALGKRFNLGISSDFSSCSAGTVGYPEMYEPKNVLGGNEFSYEAKNWSAINILLSPSVILRKKKWELMVMLKGGVQLATSPESKMMIETIAIDPFNGDDRSYLTYDQPALNDMALVYGGKLEGRYAICKKVKLLLNGGYTTSNHSFSSGPDLEYEAKSIYLGVVNTRKYSIPINFKKKISLLHFGIGLNFSF